MHIRNCDAIPAGGMQNDILLVEAVCIYLRARNGVPCVEFAAIVSPAGQRLLLPLMTCTYNIHMAPNERRRVSQTWILVGPDGELYASAQPGTLGGHRHSRIYGRLDCPAALRAIARGGYVTHRVFFLTEEHARAACYRPCSVCLPLAYASWKGQR